jgi:hypothetical protein
MNSVEESVRSALASGDPSAALAATVTAYGAELFGFLRAVMPREREARLAYGRSIEVLQRELATFTWDTDLRVLVYTVARRQTRQLRKHISLIRLVPEDLELLVLRLDRAFSWRQIAYISVGSAKDEDTLRAEVDRLRARFSVVRREISHGTSR